STPLVFATPSLEFCSGTKTAYFIQQHHLMCHPHFLISSTSKARLHPSPVSCLAAFVSQKRRLTSSTGQPIQNLARPPDTAAHDLQSPCRCSKKTSWLVPFSSIAPKCDHSLTNRSNWSRTSPPRPSSPSKTRASSTSCANLSNSQPRPPTCSRSSVARRLICRRCSRRWSTRLLNSAEQRWRISRCSKKTDSNTTLLMDSNRTTWPTCALIT